MKKFFQITFWVLVVYSAMSVDNSTLTQIAVEAFLIAVLILPAFYYEDLKNYIK